MSVNISVACSFVWKRKSLFLVLLCGCEIFLPYKLMNVDCGFPIFFHHIRFSYWLAIFYLRSCVAAFKSVTSCSILMASFLVSDVTILFIFAAYNILPSSSLRSQVK